MEWQTLRVVPAVAKDAQSDPMTRQPSDNLDAISVRLSYERDIEIPDARDGMILSVIASPLALDYLFGHANGAILCHRVGIRRHHEIEMWGDMARIVFKSPVVVAEPVDGGGIGLICDSAEHFQGRIVLRIKQDRN